MRIKAIVNEVRMDDLHKTTKETKSSKLKKEVLNARHDEQRENFNHWAESLGYEKPNKLTYEAKT